MPAPYPSMFAAYREIIPTLWRQLRDPEFTCGASFRRRREPFRPEMHGADCRAQRSRAIVTDGSSACDADDIDEEDVIRFDHAGADLRHLPQPARTRSMRPTASARTSKLHLPTGW